VLGIGILFAACGQDTTMPSASSDAFDLPADMVTIGFRTTLYVDGVVSAVLISDSAYFHEEDRRYDLIGVDVAFYTEQGAEAGTLTSQTGDYQERDGVFIARGNVVLITEGPDGPRHLETEELHYLLQGDRIWTDSPFTLLEAGRTTRGTSFQTDSKFETWEVTGMQTEGTVEGGIRF
jgi:LPS export ABC transporter protein LptC